MKNTTLIMLALCASAPMFAQSMGTMQVTKDTSVTVYGVLDAGVAEVQHSQSFDPNFPVAVNPTATSKATQSATGMFSGGLSQSRWGIKGDSAICDGMKAVFTLEGAINVPSGTVANAALSLAGNSSAVASTTAGGSQTSADSAISGQLFSRQANFGVSGTYGTLTIGRHSSFALDLIPGYDALGGSQLFTPTGFSGSYAGGGATDDSRLDNSMKYKIKVGDFNVGLMHKWGGVAGSSSAQSANQFTIGYDKAAFGIQFVYQANSDAFAVSNTAAVGTTPAVTTNAFGNAVTYQAATPGTINVAAEDTKMYMVLARYNVAKFHIKAGYEKMEISEPSNPAYDNITTLYGQNVNGAVAGSLYGATSAYFSGEKDLTVIWLGVNYDITSKLNVAVEHFNVNQNNYSGTAEGAGITNTSKMSGNSQYNSLLVDYKFSKAFDVYLGRMDNRVSRGMAVGFVNPANVCTGIGARLMF